MSRARVILTAGFSKALHVLTLAERLRRAGVTIDGVLVVSPYSWKRARALVRQRGRSVIRQALPRLLGRGRGLGTARPSDALATMMDAHTIEPGSLRDWARTHNVPYRVVASINAPDAAHFVADKKPDWVVYGGGGILHTPFIDAADGRILNAHSGPLPEIRGMNACEWSLLLGATPTVTIHLINRGIDTGGILAEHRVPVRPGDTIEVLRSRCVALGVDALYETVLHPPEELPRPRAEAAVHRQCFVLAPALQEVLARRLAKGLYVHPTPHPAEEGHLV